MSVSWAFSSPHQLRVHHARDAAEQAGGMPNDVVQTVLAEEGVFRGGLLYSPVNCATEAICVYFHGGGFVAGSPETHRCVTAWLASLSRMRVLSARYRLAPENPFPAQIDDAVAACVAALGQSGSGNTSDGSRIVLAGDSAGACIALWALRNMDPSTRARVDGLALLYGAYGLRQSGSIDKHGTSQNGLDSATLSVMYGRLVKPDGIGGPPDWPVKFASEIEEPTYVLAAELDPMFDDSLILFRNLRPNETVNEFVVAGGQQHGFLKRIGRDTVARDEVERAALWVARRVSSGR